MRPGSTALTGTGVAAAALALAPARALATTPLPAPANLAATHVSDVGADLSWPRSGLSAGDVVERLVGGAWQQYATGLFGFEALSGLTPATTYTFRVYSIPVAGFGHSTGAPSAPVSFTTLAGPDAVPPGQPPAPVFGTVTTTRVDVVWGEAADSVEITGYHVQQLVGSAWTTVRTVAAADRLQAITGLDPATAYAFAVTAVDARGNTSPRSDAATVTTLAHTGTLTGHVQMDVYSGSFFSTSMTLTNTTAAATDGWTIGFTLVDTAATNGVFGGVLARSGSSGTLTPAPYNAVLVPGAQAFVGFCGSGTPPSAFTVNGSPCSSA